MKKELKDKWVDALRSGKYEQGTLKLRPLDNKYCCLGVLGDVYDSSAWHGEHHGADNWLLTDLADVLGLDEDTQESLSCMNDEGKTFSEIADWIEENVRVQE